MVFFIGCCVLGDGVGFLFVFFLRQLCSLPPLPLAVLSTETHPVVQTEYITPAEVFFEVCLSKTYLMFCGFYMLIYITHNGALFFHKIVDSACDPLHT